MSIESIKERNETELWALKERRRIVRALLKVAEAAKVIDDAMPAVYGIMKMWVVVEYMEDLRAALDELEAQE